MGRIPVMGLNLTMLEEVGYDPATLGIFCLGVTPIIYAALIVELGALLRPRWRPLRHGGYPGRSRLWSATSVLTLILASVQSCFILRWLESTPPEWALAPEGVLSKGLVLAVPVVGQLLLLRLAELIDRRGTAHGLSVLVVAFALPRLADKAEDVIAVVQDGGQRGIEGRLILALMVTVGLVVSVARRPARGWERQPPRPDLLVPAGGALPALGAFFVLGLPSALRPFVRIESWLTVGTPLFHALELVMVLVFSAACTWTSNRPRQVAELWRRGPGHFDEPAARDAARTAVRRGFGRALAVGMALAGVVWLEPAHVWIDPVTLAVIGCVAADVAGEWRFRRDHGGVAAIWPIHRTYAVGPALATLAGAGIPAFPRGLRHGALLSFWGPYVPVEILVPAAHAEEAQAHLRALMLPES